MVSLFKKEEKMNIYKRESKNYEGINRKQCTDYFTTKNGKQINDWDLVDELNRLAKIEVAYSKLTSGVVMVTPNLNEDFMKERSKWWYVYEYVGTMGGCFLIASNLTPMSKSEIINLLLGISIGFYTKNRVKVG